MPPGWEFSTRHFLHKPTEIAAGAIQAIIQMPGLRARHSEAFRPLPARRGGCAAALLAVEKNSVR